MPVKNSASFLLKAGVILSAVVFVTVFVFVVAEISEYVRNTTSDLPEIISRIKEFLSGHERRT